MDKNRFVFSFLLSFYEVIESLIKGKLDNRHNQFNRNRNYWQI